MLDDVPQFKSIAPGEITVVATKIENSRKGNLDTNLRLIFNNLDYNCKIFHGVGALKSACLQIKH